MKESRLRTKIKVWGRVTEENAKKKKKTTLGNAYGKEIKNDIISFTCLLRFFFFLTGRKYNNLISLELTKNHKHFHFNRPETNFAI